MSVSAALKKSAKDFCFKYSCKFDFETFESRVEEFTFLRPVGGWVDVYKTTFSRLYKNALEKVALGITDANFDAEAMLDDFEYTLIRPYVKENDPDIRHKPYAGMYDRVTRLLYIDKLTKEAPSNPVDLYAEKYKNGELPIRQMCHRGGAVMKSANSERSHYAEIAGYAMALENINRTRSLVWRFFHPIKNSAEKRYAVRIKKMLVDRFNGGADEYENIASEAMKVFDGHKTVNANLKLRIERAREELECKIKMNKAIKDLGSFGNSAG